MIRFLADESCDFAVVRGLRATGYDVVAISETARGAADLAVIAQAVAEERILITEDTDFGQLDYAHAHTSSGSSERDAASWTSHPYEFTPATALTGPELAPTTVNPPATRRSNR